MSATSPLRKISPRSIWYIGIVRRYDPDLGFRVGCLIVIGESIKIVDLCPDALAKVGPHAAAAELLARTFDRMAWFTTPVELRTNDRALADLLGRDSKWHGFAIVVHKHKALEDARSHLHSRPGTRSTTVWL